jgi:hypothetical protein
MRDYVFTIQLHQAGLVIPCRLKRLPKVRDYVEVLPKQECDVTWRRSCRLGIGGGSCGRVMSGSLL